MKRRLATNEMNDPEKSANDRTVESRENADESAVDHPVMAKIVDENTACPPIKTRYFVAHSIDLAQEFQHLAAVGGAVGALVLGVWSIFCTFISPFGAINGFIAICLGFYGLRSKRKRLAVFGMVLGLIGLFLGLVEINEILSNVFRGESISGL